MTTILVNRRMAEITQREVTLYKVSPKLRSLIQRRRVKSNPLVVAYVAMRWLCFGSVPK